jgi:hypothetical protein
MSDIADALPNPNPEGQELPPEQSVPIDPASLARHYEQDDVDVRALVRFGLGIAIATVVAVGVLWVVLRIWTGQPLPFQVQVPPAAVDAPAVPGPGLDAAPEMTLQEVLARDNARLQTYGWVDREAGIVHIPIEEAMQQFVESGPPARAGDAPDFRLAPAFRMDSTGGVLPVGEGALNEDESDE